MRRGWRSDQSSGPARCVVTGRSLDFLLVAAGPSKGFKLDSSMRTICILKREIKSESPTWRMNWSWERSSATITMAHGNNLFYTRVKLGDTKDTHERYL